MESAEIKPVGFKEWQVVCDALGSGKQSLILRKGGIHEGREGFSFKHDSFYLFPTRFHAQANYVKEGQGPKETEWQPGDIVPINFFIKAERAITLTKWKDVSTLQDYHIWTEETIRERFDWEGKGMSEGSIHCALVRVYQLKQPYDLTYEKIYGGCRSWVDLPEGLTGLSQGALPVLNEESFNEVQKRIQGLA